MISRIFPDICPRKLRIAEVKLWKCPWMGKDCLTSKKIETAPEMLEQLQNQTTDQDTEKSSDLAASPFTHAESSVPESASTTSEENGRCRTDVDDWVNQEDSAAKKMNNEVDATTDPSLLEEKEPRQLVPPATREWFSSEGLPPPVPPITRSPAPLWKAVESANGRSTSRVRKRPQPRLKLEDMPTPQQAKERAQQAAT